MQNDQITILEIDLNRNGKDGSSAIKGRNRLYLQAKQISRVPSEFLDFLASVGTGL